MRTRREIPGRAGKTDRPRYHVNKGRKAPEETTLASAYSHAPIQASLSPQRWQVPPHSGRITAGVLQFKIWHRFRAPGTECASGEEVAAVFLRVRQREFHLPLSLTLRIVFD